MTESWERKEQPITNKKERIGPLEYTLNEFGDLNFGYGFSIQFGKDDEDLRDLLGTEGMLKSDNGKSDLLVLPKGTILEEKDGAVYATLPSTKRILVMNGDEDHAGNYFVREE